MEAKLQVVSLTSLYQIIELVEKLWLQEMFWKKLPAPFLTGSIVVIYLGILSLSSAFLVQFLLN